LPQLLLAKFKGVRAVDLIYDWQFYRTVKVDSSLLMVMPQDLSSFDRAAGDVFAEAIAGARGQIRRFSPARDYPARVNISSDDSILEYLEWVRNQTGLERMTAAEFRDYLEVYKIYKKGGGVSLYRRINSVLRKVGDFEQESRYVKEAAEKITRVVEMYPPVSPGNKFLFKGGVYRYANWPNLENLNAGDLVADEGITHTSASLDYALEWSSNNLHRANDTHPVFMRIRGNQGGRIIGHIGEQEVDYPPGTVFRIEGKTRLRVPSGFSSREGQFVDVVDISALTPDEVQVATSAGERVQGFFPDVPRAPEQSRWWSWGGAMYDTMSRATVVCGGKWGGSAASGNTSDICLGVRQTSIEFR